VIVASGFVVDIDERSEGALSWKTRLLREARRRSRSRR